MSHFKKILLSIFLCFIIVLSSSIQPGFVKAYTSNSLVFLSRYRASMDIGSDFYLLAITSNSELPTFKSSNSSIASVNLYGKVTAKKAGTATITARIKKGKASCKVTVIKTVITLDKTSASMEHGETLSLSATTSNNSTVTWKSSKKSVAVIDGKGLVTGLKPGETTITASADGSTSTCKITVKVPSIRLSKTKVTLFRGQSVQISASVSSGMPPVWKTNRKSVATVDAYGKITAVKHGTAVITASLDGTAKTCEVEVKQPVISIAPTQLTLKTGDTSTLTAKVSSGNSPVFSTSNPKIAVIDSNGTITAIKKGRAYYYASEDGVKVKGTLYVTD